MVNLILVSVLLLFNAVLVSAGFAATFSLNPEADAFVATGPTGNLSNNNYGGGGALAVAAGALPNGEFQSAMRFSLAGARAAFDSQFGAGQWSVASVSLELSSSPHNNAIYNNVSAGLFGVSLMANNSWVEGTGNASTPTSNGISYNTLINSFVNSGTDQALGTFNFNGTTSGATTYSLSLGSGLITDISAGAEASLRLFPDDNSVSYLFSSRSTSPVANAPLLTIFAVPEPGSLMLLGLAAGLFLRHQHRFGPSARRGS